ELRVEAGLRPHPAFCIVGPSLYLYGYGDEARARASIDAILADEGAEPWSQAGALMGLGVLDTSPGPVEAGEANLASALERMRGIGDRFSLALLLTQLAQVAEDRADHAGAESALLEALEQVELLDAREDIAWLRMRLGWIRGLAGDEAGGR